MVSELIKLLERENQTTVMYIIEMSFISYFAYNFLKKLIFSKRKKKKDLSTKPNIDIKQMYICSFCLRNHFIDNIKSFIIGFYPDKLTHRIIKIISKEYKDSDYKKLLQYISTSFKQSLIFKIIELEKIISKIWIENDINDIRSNEDLIKKWRPLYDLLVHTIIEEFMDNLEIESFQKALIDDTNDTDINYKKIENQLTKLFLQSEELKEIYENLFLEISERILKDFNRFKDDDYIKQLVYHGTIDNIKDKIKVIRMDDDTISIKDESGRYNRRKSDNAGGAGNNHHNTSINLNLGIGKDAD